MADLLARSGSLVVVGRCTNAAEVPALVGITQADVVLLCLRGGATPDNLNVLQEISRSGRSAGHGTAVVCLAAAPLPRATLGSEVCMASSASTPAQLVDIIVSAARGTPGAPGPSADETATGIAAAAQDRGLTKREREVLRGLVYGQSTVDIAENLDLSVNTVRTHVQRILGKLGAHSRLHAAAIAVDEGLI